MGSLRIFLSSTMTDELENERAAVVQRLRLFNFEPVNAEGWLPDGGGIWATIEKEIRESDLFVLILGERYGWIPKAGPKADEEVSVTHLEFRAARDFGMPILVFTKELGGKAYAVPERPGRAPGSGKRSATGTRATA